MKGLFQCPPWARSFWAFSPFLNHMRKFSYFTIKNGFPIVLLLNRPRILMIFISNLQWLLAPIT